jgi:hypothetical protein
MELAKVAGSQGLVSAARKPEQVQPAEVPLPSSKLKGRAALLVSAAEVPELVQPAEVPLFSSELRELSALLVVYLLSLEGEEQASIDEVVYLLPPKGGGEQASNDEGKMRKRGLMRK